jgi:hypothetical protein
MLAVHDAKKEDFTEAIVALMMFELWRDRFNMRMS